MSTEAIKKPRIRRSPEASRENILIAAENLLVVEGPQSLRLADVANAAGVANATVLHHFGTIDGVQSALMEKMIAELVENILALEHPENPKDGRALNLESLFDAFENKAASRLAGWLELTGESRRLSKVREAVQTVIRQKINQPGLSDSYLEDIALLSVLLAVGVGFFGPTLCQLLGKPENRGRELVLALLKQNIEQS